MSGMMITGAMMLQVALLSNITNWANVPLAMSTSMSRVVTFEASLSVSGMSARKWTVYRYPM